MRRLLAACLMAGVVLMPVRPAAQPQEPDGRLIEIVGTDKGGKYFFEPSVIAAKAGERLHVRLTTTSTAMANMPKMAMSHNFVLLEASVDPMQFATAAVAAGFQNDYLPDDRADDVIASTALAGVGESVDVSFTAPPAGSYPFICSFPGHLATGMEGSLEVE